VQVLRASASTGEGVVERLARIGVMETVRRDHRRDAIELVQLRAAAIREGWRTDQRDPGT